jgi:hypothetical protein
MTKWISVKAKLPPLCETVILAYDIDETGFKSKVTCGWIESAPHEEPSFVECESNEWLEHVTHWQDMPKGPKCP